MDEFCDVTLVSEDGKRFRAHKVVLASASTLFREMFQTGEDIEDYQVINMREVTSRFVKAMLDLVYNGETEVKQIECEEFLDLLKYYSLLKDNYCQKRRKSKCNYFNRGFCKVGRDCVFDHPREDCERHMKGKRCEDK